MSRTFSLWCVLHLQETYSNDELEPDPDGALGDLAPKADLVAALGEKIVKSVSRYVPVTEIEIDVDVELGRE